MICSCAQENFLIIIIINVENSYCRNPEFIFQYPLMNKKFKRTAFISNNVKVFTVTFDQVNASLLNINYLRIKLLLKNFE